MDELTGKNKGNTNDNTPSLNDDVIDDFFVKSSKLQDTPSVNEPQTKEETAIKQNKEPIKRKRNTENPKKRNKKAAKKIIISVASIIVILGGCLFVYSQTLPTDKISKGVCVGAINVGGKTADQAAIALSNEFDAKNHSIILATDGGEEYTITGEEIDALIDVPETINRVMEIGKDKSPFQNTINSLYLLIKNKNINPIITYNSDKLSAILNEIGVKSCGGELTEHSVTINSGSATVTPGKSGFDHNIDEIISKIDDALSVADSSKISVKFNKIAPKAMTIEMIDGAIYKDPANAQYKLENGNVTVVSEENGRYIDKEAVTSLLSTIVEGGEPVTIPYKTSAPEITAAVLKEKLFNTTLATYTTRFNAGSVNRSSNIGVAASKINGAILLNDETFSFNTRVGKRSIANGFKTAPEYQQGQTVQGIGGGTCQVSTTLYSALLYADLKIVARSNHSMTVSYVPLGQDATVTDGGTDLKFKNDSGYPVKIVAKTNGGSITVSIIGTAPTPAKTVKIVHTPVSASTGTAISTKRIVSDSSGNVIKEENMGTSRYKPHDSSSSSSSAPSSTPASANKTPEESSGSSSAQTQAPTTVPSAPTSTQKAEAAAPPANVPVKEPEKSTHEQAVPQMDDEG